MKKIDDSTEYNTGCKIIFYIVALLLCIAMICLFTIVYDRKIPVATAQRTLVAAIVLFGISGFLTLSVVYISQRTLPKFIELESTIKESLTVYF